MKLLSNGEITRVGLSREVERPSILPVRPCKIRLAFLQENVAHAKVNALRELQSASGEELSALMTLDETYEQKGLNQLALEMVLFVLNHFRQHSVRERSRRRTAPEVGVTVDGSAG